MAWHQWIGWGLFVVGVSPAVVALHALFEDWWHDTSRRERRWQRHRQQKGG